MSEHLVSAVLKTQLKTPIPFFRNPGDVMLGDIVQVRDREAGDLSSLSESDQVEIDEP